MFKDRKGKNLVVGDRPDPARPDEGFLGRWSRRKATARTRQDKKEERPAVGESAADATLKAEAAQPVEPKTDADMPPIETLDENSDYSGFLSPNVSNKLRRLALRKLFHMSGFNIRDGLDDYDEDYTTFEALGNTITADMRHQMEREKEEARQRLAEEEAAEPTDAQAAEPTEERERIDVAATDDDSANDAPGDKTEPDNEDGEVTPTNG
ncbi:MAG: DUF3306 domain-containing protein [Acidiferrobacterales bacterium]